MSLKFEQTNCVLNEPSCDDENQIVFFEKIIRLAMKLPLCSFFFKNVDFVKDTFVLSTGSLKMSSMQEKSRAISICLCKCP